MHLHMRSGQPSMQVDVQEDNAYWLGNYHEFDSESCKGGPASGIGDNYNAVNRVRLSKDFYDPFMEESSRNE